MAQNIAPTLGIRENEVQGLLAWSCLPCLISGGASLVLGALGLFYLSISGALIAPTLVTTSFAVESIAFVWLGWQCLRLFHSARRYSHTEDDASLVSAMLELGSVWISLGVVFVSGATPAVLHILRQMFPFALVRTPWLWFGIPILGGILYYFDWRTRRISRTKPFVHQIGQFGNSNLLKIRIVALAAILVGVLYLGLYATNRLAWGIAFPFTEGVAAILIGASLVFVWKGVREINRNSTLIYFERTLEKLNFFWLALTASLALRLSLRLWLTLFG